MVWVGELGRNTCVHTYTNRYNIYMKYIYTHTQIHRYIDTYTHTHTHTQIHTYVCTYLYIRTYIHTNIHIHIRGKDLLHRGVCHQQVSFASILGLVCLHTRSLLTCSSSSCTLMPLASMCVSLVGLFCLYTRSFLPNYQVSFDIRGTDLLLSSLSSRKNVWHSSRAFLRTPAQ